MKISYLGFEIKIVAFSFVPQAQVLALNYLFPTEKVPEILDWMVRNGEFMPLLENAKKKTM